MLLRSLLVTTFVGLAMASALAQSALPMRRIVLFKNGMAQIVRTGEIQEATSLSFHSEDMNDILKSFIAWNPEDLSLYSTGYSSAIPVSTLLGRYDFDLRDPDLTLARFIKQFRGRVLQVTDASGEHRGRVVAVEEKDRLRGEVSQSENHLTLVADDQGIRTFWMSDLQQIRLEDSSLNQQLAAYLEVMSEGTGDSLRQITVYPIPRGGPIQMAYVQQFPVWKTTYRLELEGKSSLQAWALVDNPTGEPWDSVDLTLIAGLPTSFRMELYPPVMRTRPTLPLPLGELSAVIQAQAEYSVQSRSAAKRVSAPPPGQAVVDELRVAELPIGGRASLDMLELSPRNSGIQFPEPEAVATQDYFEYRFPSPITLQAGQSALLPFLNKPVETRRISIYQVGTSRVHPSLAAEIKNTTGSPLEPGPVTVLQQGRYAGEGVLGQLPRQEEAILSYGTDYDLEIFGEVKTGEARRTRAKIESGLALVTHEVSETTTYQVRNKGAEKKHLIVEHPRRPNRRLDAENVRMTRDFYRFGLDFTPGQSRQLPVREILSWEQSIFIGDLDESSIAEYFSGAGIPDRVLSQLRDVLRRRSAIAALERQREALGGQIEEMFQDQERVRKNLQALGRTEEEKTLRDLYVRQFGTQETRLSELRDELKALEQQVEIAGRELEAAILAITWEGKL